jgi:hypothetical protein
MHSSEYPFSEAECGTAKTVEQDMQADLSKDVLQKMSGT